MLARLSCILGLASAACAAVLHAPAPQVKIGKTTLIGRAMTGLRQDFFGGMLGYLLCSVQ